MDVFKIKIMDVNSKVREDNLLPVTSTFTKESSSDRFHDEGLFSERIFGEVASEYRIKQLGYIELNTEVIHPKLYSIIVKMKSFYESIMQGMTYAVFDESLGEFVRVDPDDSGAETGYSFFIKHISKLSTESNEAIRHDTKMEILDKNKEALFISKMPVIPAGLREYREKNGRGDYDDINKLYMSLINLARALSEKHSDINLFDPVMYSIQRKVVMVYEYIADIVEGKKGFFQGKYGARSVALGTRNVITATDMTASSLDDKSLLRSDEILIPLYQVINMLKPMVIYHLKNIFFNSVFNRDTTQASLIDPDTLGLVYRSIPLSEKAKFLTSNKIADQISMFRDDAVKHMPVTVMDDSGSPMYLYLTYRDKDMVYLARSINDLESNLVTSGKLTKLIHKNIRPLTYFEMFYIAATATLPKYTIVTRFPVTGEGSTFPAKIHVASTTSYETIRLASASNDELYMTLDRFPIHGVNATGGMSVHPSQLAPIGGD